MNVIFHIDEMERWDLVLGNVKNMTAYYQETKEAYTIEVLANSAAVKGYVKNGKDKEAASLMAGLAEAGICFTACNNALKGNGISLEMLHGFVHVVPAGVVELAKKQSEGFAYIRP